MQATITIDDELFAQAVGITALNDSDKIIDMALREFINNHQPAKNRLMDLFGAGGIREDYDYTQHRRSNPFAIKTV